KTSQKYYKGYKFDQIINWGALICLVALVSELVILSGYFIKSQISSLIISANITTQENENQETQSKTLPEENVITVLRNQYHPWAKIISSLEETAGIKFDRLQSQNNNLIVTGKIISQEQNSLTSLAKSAEKLKQLPFVSNVIIKSSDKNQVSEKAFSSNFVMEISFNWNSLRDTIMANQDTKPPAINSSLPAVEDFIAIGEISTTGENIISLTWNQNPQAAMYMIFGGSNEANFKFIGSTSETKFQLSNNDPRQVYTFQIFPLDSQGNYGMKSAVASARAGDDKAPKPVQNLSVSKAISETKDKQIIVTTALKWDDASDQKAKSYLIFSGYSQGSLNLIAETNELYFVSTQSSLQTPPIWGVISKDASNNRSKAAIVNSN
ncbi:MAG: hypothetical protein NTZ80_00020, partial [Patescibacteria group bacterium]|nr:hypothetical protein [Patescibacteria group bacterium]